MTAIEYIKEYFTAAHSWLRVKKDIVNKLNIFPVPDGDTGTNMLNTIASAAESVQEEHSSLASLSSALIDRALWGARGNSGVILANFLKGFFSRLTQSSNGEISFAGLASALKHGRDEAYTSAIDPVEGTILTLMNSVWERTEELAADPGLAISEYLEDIYRHSQKELERTPELLDILKRAGVVDAGACGFFYIIEAVYRRSRDLPADLSAKHEGYIPEIKFNSTELGQDLDSTFCLEITMKISKYPTEQIVKALQDFGTSEVAINSGDLVKIHLHTDTPEPAVACAEKYAQVLDVYRENMVNQQYKMLADIKYEYDGYPGIASVVAGSGMSEVFRELGSQVVIDGGRTMNPSVAEIVEGLRETGKKNIILFPNNKDAFLTCREAAGLADAEVEVINSGSMPEGIAALMNYSPAFTFRENIDTMTEALKQAQWNFITRAELDTPEVKKGQYFAGKYKTVLSQGSLEEVTEAILKKTISDDISLVTVYTGENAEDSEIETVRNIFSSLAGDAEIEFIYGGQPNYNLLLSYE